MFVQLPGGWLSHSFLVGRFRIKSEAQIRKIVDCGFTEVDVEADKSDPQAMADARHVPEAAKSDPAVVADVRRVPEAAEQDIPVVAPSTVAEFAQAEDAIAGFAASSRAPDVKAKAVYSQSLEVVRTLFEDPSSAFIGSSKRVVGKVVDLILADDDTTECLLKVSSHDQYTYTHSMNVGVYATALAKKIYRGRAGHDMRELGAGFFLHDLGKIRVPNEIINKPGRLTPEEFAVIMGHPIASYDILKETSQLSDECSVVALQHHEREDGTGYPCGLKGDEIHDYARICSIADVFDALTSRRSYREPTPAFGAIQIMRDEMLGHFHKEMLRDFIMLFRP